MPKMNNVVGLNFDFVVLNLTKHSSLALLSRGSTTRNLAMIRSSRKYAVKNIKLGVDVLIVMLTNVNKLVDVSKATMGHKSHKCVLSYMDPCSSRVVLDGLCKKKDETEEK